MSIASRKAIILLAIVVVLAWSLYDGPSNVARAASTPTPKPTSKTAALCGITGMVKDPGGKGVAGARVSVYNVTRKNSGYVETGLTTIEQNPQLTGDGSSGIRGMYVFTGLPAGTYNIVVEIGGERIVKTVTPTSGTVTVQDIIVRATITPAPGPEPTSDGARPTPTPVATAIPGPDPTPEKAGPGLLNVLLAVAVCAQFIFSCIVLFMYALKRI